MARAHAPRRSSSMTTTSGNMSLTAKTLQGLRNLCYLVLLGLTAVSMPAQTFTTIHSFNGADGNNVQGALLQGTDGNLYGSTYYGGANDDGTLFKLSPAGVLTTLANFDGIIGSGPAHALIQGTDGSYYGTTDNLAPGDWKGIVFKITPNGDFVTIHHFQQADGTLPRGGLVRGPSGFLYGVTVFGGNFGGGTIYSISPTDVFTTIHSFGVDVHDGFYPYEAPVLAPDGNLYGTTFSG